GPVAMRPLSKRPRTVPVTPQAVTTTHRGFTLGSLLALAIATPCHALVKKVPIAPGSTQLVPYSPPYTPPQPPMPPGTPVITQRTPFSISLGFIVDDPSVTANAIERSGADGVSRRPRSQSRLSTTPGSTCRATTSSAAPTSCST